MRGIQYIAPTLGAFLMIHSIYLSQAVSNSRGLSRNHQQTPAVNASSSYNKPEVIEERRRSGKNQRNQETRSGDRRVPFWSIAHMINSIEQIEPALSSGANGIETDISFDKRGFPVESYHGFPCDCGRYCHYREDLGKFMRHLGEITAPPEFNRLLVVVLDLKLQDLNAGQKVVAGRELARILHQNVYERYLDAIKTYDAFTHPPVRFVVSINHVKDIGLVKAFIGYMRENQLDLMSKQVGFDVGMNDDLNEISQMWNELNGATFNVWQGDGLTNCANIVRGIERLKEAISIRNAQGHFRKVYFWTADIMYQIRSVLRLGIDAMLTNQPQRVNQVLEEPEFKGKYRLAGPYDDPFSQFWIQPSAWKMSLPSLSEVGETVANIQKTGSDFVQNLPDGITAAIKKVHSTIMSH